MRSSTKRDGADRRKAERRASASSSAAATESVPSERRVLDNRGVVTSMVDALADILEWERASERSMRVASVASVASGDSNVDLDASN